MGLRKISILCAALTVVVTAGSLRAAPMLRLKQATVGPYSIAAGTNGASLGVDSWNAGDGSLALQLKSSATWVVPTLGASRRCTDATVASSCQPVQLAFQTASLAKGTYTATVTVSDPKAVDSPQTLTVVVQIGGGVPDKIEMYAAPGGSASAKLTTNTFPTVVPATQQGGQWLSIASDGQGSFSFGVTTTVVAAPPAQMSAGDYRGSVTVSHSTFGPDNKKVDVLLHVTTQPIASVPESLSFRIAAKMPKQTQYLVIGSLGTATLSISELTISGAAWLTAADPGKDTPLLRPLTVDPTGLDAGTYNGTITVKTNAVNATGGTFTIPVKLEVVPQSPAWAYYAGTVNNATFNSAEPVAQGDIVALFGEQLAYDGPQLAPKIPLDSKLGNTRVLVNGNAVPLYFTSYGQINFQMPFEAPTGRALVQVERDGQTGNTVSVQVVGRSPHILPYGDYGVIQNASQNNVLPLPATPAHPGDVLVMYCLGMGATAPAVATGAGAPTAEPLARLNAPVFVVFGTHKEGTVLTEGITPDYAGLAPYFVGLYQVNVRIPDDAPKGNLVPVWLYIHNGNETSNVVNIAIQ